MLDLIPDEIETLRMLAGQLPARHDAKEMICIMQLSAFGLCSSEAPHSLTTTGIACLEAATGAIDLQSRRTVTFAMRAGRF